MYNTILQPVKSKLEIKNGFYGNILFAKITDFNWGKSRPEVGMFGKNAIVAEIVDCSMNLDTDFIELEFEVNEAGIEGEVAGIVQFYGANYILGASFKEGKWKTTRTKFVATKHRLRRNVTFIKGTVRTDFEPDLYDILNQFVENCSY